MDHICCLCLVFVVLSRMFIAALWSFCFIIIHFSYESFCKGVTGVVVQLFYFSTFLRILGKVDTVILLV